jgi:3-oxoacyl-[acyl-carrier protein] reductase
MLTIDLTGNTALVVGGSRGIGAGIVVTLARAGAHVVFTHTGRHPARVDELLSAVRSAGGTVEAVAAEATAEAEMTACVEALVAARGQLDILVHNAGRNQARPVETMTLDSWHDALDCNLTSAYISVRAAMPHMLAARRGRIILIGSSAFYNGGGGALDYAAAKSGLVGMMTYLAREYSRKGILTNVIHPGAIETDLLKERYGEPEQRAALVAQMPVGRLGVPEDIAGLTAFLASPLGDFICGQSILVDGGRTLYR